MRAGERSPVPQFPPIVLDRTHAATDTDTATRQTIAKMCELIRDSATDPEVQRIALHIKKRFACDSSDPAELAWGVFWWMKHSIKFRTDEATMFRLGQSNEQDLLISPAVLVRMKDPSEDCDGFTMLAAALLTVLQVPVVIATIAADMDDPSRWSHVFLCAIVNGRVLPLDTSHGSAPGWMVPRSRIHRWQTWTLDGQQADVPIPTFHGLHGYVRRGVGAPSTQFGGGPISRTTPCAPPNYMFNGVCIPPQRFLPPGASRVPARAPLMLVPKRAGMGQANCWCEDGSDPSLGYCEDDSDPVCGSSTQINPLPTTPVICPAGQSDNGYGGCVATSSLQIPSGGTIVGTPNQASYTPAQLAAIIAAGGSSAVSIIRTATGGPYTVAGTNLVYNPATGQLSSATNPLGLNLSTLNLSALTSNIPLIAGVILVILIVPNLLGRK